ncbi:hypothetical protein [Kitasatospora purpeofusca]|uniref:hypothetical protein n=1 Tax=Kitasatospora purpeofusca TaxID=67352 RepID=UPI0036D3442A
MNSIFINAILNPQRGRSTAPATTPKSSGTLLNVGGGPPRSGYRIDRLEVSGLRSRGTSKLSLLGLFQLLDALAKLGELTCQVFHCRDSRWLSLRAYETSSPCLGVDGAAGAQLG